MATTSLLKTQMNTASAANPAGWTTFEAAVEVIANAITLGIGPGIAGTAGTPNAGVLSVQGITNGTVLQTNDAALIAANHTDLAAILAKQPSLGTAGTASANVITVQGIASGTAQACSDAGAAWTTVRGVAGVPFTSADQHSAVASVTDAPTSGQKLVITDLIISSDTALSVSFNIESDATVIYGPFYLAAGSTVNLVTRAKLKLGTANKKLQVQSSVAGNISVLALYYSEA